MLIKAFNYPVDVSNQCDMRRFVQTATSLAFALARLREGARVEGLCL